jgi:Tfp pilus assembly protein PilV
MSRSGFTLLEAVLAVFILTVGLLGLVGALARITRLGAAGRERGRVAVALESRVDWLVAQARGNACTPPGSGTARRPDGTVEQWSARPAGHAIEALIVVQSPGRLLTRDTLLVRFPCE